MPPKKSAAAVPVQKGPEEPASKETYGELALPDKMYAFAGQPIKLYFLNVTEYASCGEVTLKQMMVEKELYTLTVGNIHRKLEKRLF